LSADVERFQWPVATHSLAGTAPKPPEDRQVFRLAQLLLLMEVSQKSGVSIPTVDRLGYLDFFSANPFVVVRESSEREARERTTLRLAGFSGDQLSYASAGQRFVSRRRRLQHDLALLLGYGLVRVGSEGYELTEPGVRVAEQLSTVYADAYRESAAVILRLIGKSSNAQLRKNAEKWLGHNPLLLDFLDDVLEETTVDAAHTTEGKDTR